jgi:hypothetical protein
MATCPKCGSTYKAIFGRQHNGQIICCAITDGNPVRLDLVVLRLLQEQGDPVAADIVAEMAAAGQ